MWGATGDYGHKSQRHKTFQSTLPVWGATAVSGTFGQLMIISIHAPRVGSDQSSFTKRARERNFNPRSPCGERLVASRQAAKASLFQSTLPVWGATSKFDFYNPLFAFQSTLPVWGATAENIYKKEDNHISIHAPRVGSDFSAHNGDLIKLDFNPRSPCGERHLSAGAGGMSGFISIHAPRVGSDRGLSEGQEDSWYFNPRSPCGERLHHHQPGRKQGLISIHAPRVGSDRFGYLRCAQACEISIHAPRVGSDLNRVSGQMRPSVFQSTLPVWGAT